MKIYLEEDKQIYAKDCNDLVYRIADGRMEDTCIMWNLELYCGWDYINPDENNIQGYVPANRFIEEVQYDTVIQYFFEEGLKECLGENGYIIVHQPIIEE